MWPSEAGPVPSESAFALLWGEAPSASVLSVLCAGLGPAPVGHRSGLSPGSQGIGPSS